MERKGCSLYNNYVENGVIIRPNVIAEGDDATVVYKGLLFNNGADQVYMHIGYGDHWEHATDIPMTRTNEGFKVTFPVTQYKPLHMAFKDSADHWDNNSGSNYSFQVQAR